MTIEQLRAAYGAQPFVPFIVHLADGRQIPVPSPEFILAAPSGRTFAVYKQDAFHVIDLLLVTDLEFKPTPNGSGRRRRGQQ
jgi:hypothetical protein